MRRSLPAVLGVAILLAGCSTAGPEEITWPEPPPSTTTVPTVAPTSDEELALNEWAAAECAAGQFCEINFRVTDILLSDQCEFGLKDPAEPLGAGTRILTLYTEAEAEFTPGGQPYLFANPQAVVDEDSAARPQPASYDQPCADNPAHVDHQYLLTGIDEGGQAKFADIFAIPADTTALLFEGYRLPLPELNASTGANTTPPPLNDAPGQATDAGGGAGTGGPADADAAQDTGSPGRAEECNEHCRQSEPKGEEQETAPPYRCADSDLRVSDPADCLNEDPAPEPTTSTPPTSPQESQPDSPSFENQFEAQLWSGCTSGSITDELLCDTTHELYGEP